MLFSNILCLLLRHQKQKIIINTNKNDYGNKEEHY
nr:MAG TPA: hypothetical protein [Caudoviricetes sp.]